MGDMEIVRAALEFPGPIDCASVAQQMGIAYKEIEHNVDGKISYDQWTERYTISVNSELSVQRRRFAAAHEIAHYLMHRDIIRDPAGGHVHHDILFGKNIIMHGAGNAGITDSYQNQANVMAIKMIMPADRIIRFLDKGMSVEDICADLDVTPASLNIRIRGLKHNHPHRLAA